MRPSSARRLARAFAQLLVLGLAGLALTVWGGAAGVPFPALVLAMLKARLVILDFLGLRDGPRPLRAALFAWALLLAAAALLRPLAAAL